MRTTDKSQETELDRRERELVRSRQKNGAPLGTQVPALRICRVYADFTVTDLMRESGISRQTINSLEDGGRARKGTIEALAKALDLQPETLVRDFGNEEGSYGSEEDEGTD